jgi:hypothetical protein
VPLLGGAAVPRVGFGNTGLFPPHLQQHPEVVHRACMVQVGGAPPPCLGLRHARLVTPIPEQHPELDMAVASPLSAARLHHASASATLASSPRTTSVSPTPTMARASPRSAAWRKAVSAIVGLLAREAARPTGYALSGVRWRAMKSQQRSLSGPSMVGARAVTASKSRQRVGSVPAMGRRSATPSHLSRSSSPRAQSSPAWKAGALR